MKYPIGREFFPYSRFKPPIKSPKTAGWLGSKMRPPRKIMHDGQVKVTKHSVKSYDGAEIEVLVFEPNELEDNCACLVYCHGGGFFFGAAGYHYKLAKRYALETPCKVVFVQYRLTPKNPHPTPSEDCYAALRWVYDRAQELKINRAKIAVGGDSAGGALAAAVCHMARDRGTALPLFQLLIYPVTDRRMDTPSNKLYVDTPMWNSRLSAIMWQGYIGDGNVNNIAYASPMEAKSFIGLPPAYVEVAQFDCLRDEGIAYAEALRSFGVETVVNETEGTMHGFDIAQKAPATQAAIAQRLQYMKKSFF